MTPGPRSANDPAARGQTSIDFLIGTAVFLLAVTFVFATIPGMIDPFSDAQEETLVADRVATQLAESMLGERDAPSKLNETCAFGFFNESQGDGAGCPVAFDETESDLGTKVGIDDRYRLNVTIERNVTGGAETEILCADGEVVHDCTGSGSRLAAGPTPPTAADSITSARRTVFLDERDMTLVVRVW